jgi:hypothetical protein
MKSKKINILLAVAFGAVLSLGGCKKDDGPIPSRVTVDAVPTISTNVDATTASLSIAAASSFAGKFTISQYFPGSAVPSKIDIIVRRNASATGTISNANIKTYKLNAVSSYPQTFTVTAAEIQALFGVAFVDKEVYDFGIDFYVGDKKYEAFPAASTGTGAGTAAMPLFGEFARFTVKP